MWIIRFFSMALLFSCLNTLGQIKPLDAVSRCADRLINDASFELTEVNQNPLAFPIIVDCMEYGSGSVITAKGIIVAPADSLYLAGINSSEPAKIYINGECIADIAGNSSPFPSEIAYDLYEFHYYFKVTLKKGENKMEVRTVGKLSLGIVDYEGFPEKNVSYRMEEYESPTDRFVPKVFKEYKLKVKEGAAFTKHPYTEWHYASGTTVFGLMALAKATSNRKYSDFAKKFCNFSVNNIPLFSKQYYQQNSLRGQNYRMFRMAMLDDGSAPALPLVELLVNGDNSVESRELIEKIADYVMKKQTRLEDGTFARPEPKWTIWADDLFMSVPFLVRCGRFSGDKNYFDEAANQIKGFDKYLYDVQTGLYYHGWNDTKKEYAGLLWGRANGWMAWAISEALLNIPENYPQYQTLLDIHRRQLETVVKYQDEEGMWHQLLNMPSSYRETSATAIFVMTIARAVREGWIDKKYADNAVRGWQAIESRIDDDGIVSGICQSTSILANAELYMNQKTMPNDPRGMGAVLMAAVEVNKLVQNERIIYNDSRTGNEVWQITNHDSISNMPYFEAQAFTADDTWVIFKSNRDGGVWKIFRSNMATGEISKVSDMENESSYTIMPDGKRVAFMNGNTIYAVDVATLETETIMSFEPTEDLKRFSASFTADGRYTLVSLYNENTGTRIFRIDVPEKKAELVFSTSVRLSHPLINPRYPNLITYVPSPDRQDDYTLSLEERARDYIVDTNTGIAKPFLMMPVQSRATHETWSADGERFYFFHKKRNSNKGSFGIVSICSVDKNGSDWKEYYTSTDYKLGHGLADKEQKWFITDSQNQIENPLMKIDLATGEAVILCWPNSSQTSETNDQTDHVHPIISASGKYVAFTSDGNSREVPQAFVIPVKKLQETIKE